MSEDSGTTVWRRQPPNLTRLLEAASARNGTLLLVVSMIVAAFLLLGGLDRGWFHHDDGSLAQSAERVLAGELPHRDFDDLYTGLLSFVNAAVFAILGHDILYLRVPLFISFVAFTGFFFALTRRLMSPPWAFVATLVAIVWSVPIYPAPMPSWYLLFLSTAGTYALARFYEAGSRYWVFAAGVCGGIAVTIKVVGVWFVVATVLWLLIKPLLDSRAGLGTSRPSRLHAATVIGSALLASLLITAVVSGNPGDGEIAALLLPVLVMCLLVAALGWREWVMSEGEANPPLLTDVFVLLAGAAIPLLIFSAPYLITASMSDLAQGVLVAPRSRFEYATAAMPEAETLLRALPVVVLLLLRPVVSEHRRRLLDVGAGALMTLLVLTAASTVSYSIVFGIARALAPVTVVLGVAAVISRRPGASPTPGMVGLLVFVGGFATVFQFPYGVPLYFCYVAPLVLLAAIASLRRLGAGSGLLPGIVLLALAVFGFRFLDHQTLASLGKEFKPEPRTVLLDGDIARVRVPPAVKNRYDRVRYLVARHRTGDVIFAGPDAPEVYYLTRSENPTRVLLDFLDGSGSTRGERLMQLLGDARIGVVVINHRPQQSRRYSAGTIDQIRARYGGVEYVGRFEVRWKNRGTGARTSMAAQPAPFRATGEH